MGVRLPPEYQEVQYIQCSGYQYINTGVNLSSDDFEVFCRFAITQTAGYYEQALFSIWTSEYNYWNCLMRNNLDISVYTAAHHTANKRVVIGQMYNITVIRNVDTWSCVFDDDVVTWTYSPTKINDTPLTLCRRADIPNYANSATHARIYDFSVKANGTIVAKYVPCYRKSDNKPGMYDLVSGTFFVNQDTGEDFTVGPDVIDSISPWLVARRRVLMQQEPELYPVGTDVIALYAQNWVDDSSWANTGGTSSISGAARCTNYIPIDPRYTYRKNNYRLYNYCCWYDADKHFIRSFALNNTTAQDITNIPQNARYMRVSTYKANKAQLKVIRTA